MEKVRHLRKGKEQAAKHPVTTTKDTSYKWPCIISPWEVRVHPTWAPHLSSTRFLNCLASVPTFSSLITMDIPPSSYRRPAPPLVLGISFLLTLLIDVALPKLSHISQTSKSFFMSVDHFPISIQTYSSITYLKNKDIWLHVLPCISQPYP